LLLTLGVLLCACGSSAVTVERIPTPRPQPTPTPTVVLGFRTGVSDVQPKPHHAPRRVVHLPPPPAGPYLRISPNTGIPRARNVTVSGGHLPPNHSVQLVWSTQSVLSSVATTTKTDKNGRLSITFRVPAASPGSYRIVGEVGGTPLVSASYTVTSPARLSVAVQPGRHALTLDVSGKRFLPNAHLNLLLYPLVHKARGTVLARTQADGSGAFHIRINSNRLAPGEYMLSAFSTGATVETAQTYFQVVV